MFSKKSILTIPTLLLLTLTLVPEPLSAEEPERPGLLLIYEMNTLRAFPKLAAALGRP